MASDDIPRGDMVLAYIGGVLALIMFLVPIIFGLIVIFTFD